MLRSAARTSVLPNPELRTFKSKKATKAYVIATIAILFQTDFARPNYLCTFLKSRSDVFSKGEFISSCFVDLLFQISATERCIKFSWHHHLDGFCLRQVSGIVPRLKFYVMQFSILPTSARHT